MLVVNCFSVFIDYPSSLLQCSDFINFTNVIGGVVMSKLSNLNDKYLSDLLIQLSHRAKEDKKYANAASSLRSAINLGLFNGEDDVRVILINADKFKAIGKKFHGLLLSDWKGELSDKVKKRLSVKKSNLKNVHRLAVELQKTQSLKDQYGESESGDIWRESDFIDLGFGQALLKICNRVYPELKSQNAISTQLSELAKRIIMPDTIRRHLSQKVSLGNIGRASKSNIPKWDKAISLWERHFDLPVGTLRNYLPKGTSIIKKTSQLSNPNYLRGGDGTKSYPKLAGQVIYEWKVLSKFMSGQLKLAGFNSCGKRDTPRFPKYQPVNRMKPIKRKWKVSPRDNRVVTADGYETHLRSYQYFLMQQKCIVHPEDFRLSHLLIQEYMEAYIDWRISLNSYGSLDLFLGFLISQVSSGMSSLCYLSIFHTPIEYYGYDENVDSDFLDWQGKEADFRSMLVRQRIELEPDLKTNKNDGQRNITFLVDREYAGLHEYDLQQSHKLTGVKAGTREYYMIANSLAESAKVGGHEGLLCRLYSIFMKMMMCYPMRISNWMDLVIVPANQRMKMSRERPVIWRNPNGVWELSAPKAFVKNNKVLSHKLDGMTDEIDVYIKERTLHLSRINKVTDRFIISPMHGEYGSISTAKSSFGQGLSRYTYGVIKDLWPERIDNCVFYGLNPHACRHFSATSALAHGADAAVVQTLLQDSPRVTEEIYARLDKLKIKHQMKSVHSAFVEAYDY